MRWCVCVLVYVCRVSLATRGTSKLGVCNGGMQYGGILVPPVLLYPNRFSGILMVFKNILKHAPQKQFFLLSLSLKSLFFFLFMDGLYDHILNIVKLFAAIIGKDFLSVFYLAFFNYSFISQQILQIKRWKTETVNQYNFINGK